MELLFQSWARLASNFIGECFDQAKPCVDNEFTGIDALVRFVSAQLYIDCHLSSESALILILNQKEWDADLITRSVLEGSFKLVYMLYGNAEQKLRKAHEFWNVLPLFSSVRHSERLQRLIDALKNPNDPRWIPYHDLLLSEDEVSEIRANYSAKVRKKLEEDWSFVGISRLFASSQDPGLNNLVHLAHGYGMSSHLLHKDADGVGMVWERYGRDTEAQSAVKLGHSARVVLDICSFAELRLFSVLRASGQPTEPMFEIRQKYRPMLFDELEKASLHFAQVEYGSRT
jgi:hypothetical protein